MSNSAFNQSQSPYASEAVAGLVEEATQAQVESATDVGETGAKLFVPPSKLPAGDTVNAFIADEAITVGDAVAIKSGATVSSQLLEESSFGFNLTNNAAWYANAFVASPSAVSLKKITLKIAIGTAGGTLQVAIRTTLAGVDLYNYVTHTYAASETSVDVKDNINLALTPGVTYYVCVYQTSAPGGGESNRRRIVGTNTLGNIGFESSSSGGNPWVANNAAFYMIVEETQSNALERVVKASASTFDSPLNFVGFAKNTASFGQTVNIDFSTVVSPSGGAYTAGSTYYLSNTPGALSTSPGTRTRYVGRAISTTKLVRFHGPVSTPYAINSGVAPTTGMFQGHNAGGQHTMTIDSVTYTVLNGMAGVVRRGTSFSISAGAGYFVVMDYGGII